MVLRWHVGFFAVLLWAAPLSAQETDSRADSVALRIAAASGGQVSWDDLPFFRFDFKLYRERELVYAIQHLWDKKLGIYRMELPGPASEPYVAVFYTDTFEGKVYWKGSELIPKDAELLMERVRSRYYHDPFFVALPFMLMEPGVVRTYLPDSSGASEAVIRVSMPRWEGLPTTTFYVHADRESGRLARTSYRLPSGEMRTYVWQGYEEFASVSGSLVLSTRKRAERQPFLIETVGIMLPPMVGTDVFRSPTPVLQPRPSDVEPEDPGQRG